MAVKLATPSMVNRTIPYQAPASTVFVANSMVSPNEGGAAPTFVATTSSTHRILGMNELSIASTDSNYASIKTVPVVVDEFATWEVTATGATSNKVQFYCDFADNVTIAVGTTTLSHFFVQQFISSTLVRGQVIRFASLESPVVS